MASYEHIYDAIQDSLLPAEEISFSAKAQHEERGLRWFKPQPLQLATEKGLLVVTNNRVIYQSSWSLGRGSRLEWPLSQINSLRAVTKYIAHAIEINAGGTTFNFAYYGDSAEFVNAYNESLSNLKRGALDGNFDLTEQIAKLASLHESGALTKEEFQQAKKRLLEN